MPVVWVSTGSVIQTKEMSILSLDTGWQLKHIIKLSVASSTCPSFSVFRATRPLAIRHRHLGFVLNLATNEQKLPD
jgi:hypothetical protein